MTDTKSTQVGWNFDNSYARLPEFFYARLPPRPVRAPNVVVLNHDYGREIGLSLSALSSDEAAAVFSGNLLPDGAAPLAQAYAGHQFGHFTMLGDGRAHLLGEHLAPDGRRLDIQFKGSGPTPFSRRGDGRAALGPMLREYIISEAMAALGIPTTRSLAVVVTGEPVYRETPLAGAILTRVAKSHIRVGTFEYVGRRKNREGLQELVLYTLKRHHPDLHNTVAPSDAALALLSATIEKQATLIASWMLMGFVHGVMNTDNMALSGETIDYGPCAFMDRYDQNTVFSSIDSQGRYAYGNQAPIALWNLTRLAEMLLPLLSPMQDRAIQIAEETLKRFVGLYETALLDGMRNKLGLFTKEDDDASLVEELLAFLQETGADYTNTLRSLAEGGDNLLQDAGSEEGRAAKGFGVDRAFVDFYGRYQARLARQPQSPEAVKALRLVHCPWVIPRNHQVEKALSAAASGDLSVMERLVTLLRSPFVEPNDADREYRLPPKDSERVCQTFCGT